MCKKCLNSCHAISASSPYPAPIIDVKLSSPKALKLDADSKLAASINLLIKYFHECVLKWKERPIRLKTKANSTNKFTY